MRPDRALVPVGMVVAAALAWRRRQWNDVRLEDLLGRAGGPNSCAKAVNDAGQVAGSASGVAFRWTDGVLEELGPGGGGSEGNAISQSGEVVGCMWTVTRPRTAARWGPVGAVALDVPGPLLNAVARGINEAGDVVGEARDPRSNRSCALLWRGRAVEVLPDRGGGAAALGVSTQGHVVGHSTDAAGRTRAVLWKHGGLIDLGTLGGAASAAQAVDEDGTVVGWSLLADGTSQAFRWQDGAMTALPGADAGGSAATAVSNGAAVGWLRSDVIGEPRACLWRGESLVELGTLGGTSSTAWGINASGTVVGTACTGAGATGLPLRPGGWSWESHAFRSTPSGGTRRPRRRPRARTGV